MEGIGKTKKTIRQDDGKERIREDLTKSICGYGTGWNEQRRQNGTRLGARTGGRGPIPVYQWEGLNAFHSHAAKADAPYDRITGPFGTPLPTKEGGVRVGGDGA